MKLKVQVESYPQWAATLMCGNNVVVRVPFRHYDGCDSYDEAAYAMADFLGMALRDDDK